MKKKKPDGTNEKPRAAAPAKARNAARGGRFASGPAEIMERINVSIDFDRRLYAQDIAGSQAHCAMLVRQKLLSPQDGEAIDRGLGQIRAEIEAGTFPFRSEHEDIHLNIEARLGELIGPAAGRLHTARSRNDQVATDFRLWVRDAIDRIDRHAQALQAALVDHAEQHAATIMPGFTHLQPAQPVTFGHHLLAYVEMLARDRGRLGDARARLNECPLDAAADRDFALETLAAAAITAMHLSRFAEEIIIWMTPQFSFVRLSDKFTTGSSIMPQKRNPDAAELVRAKVGRVAAAFQALLMVMKGLPLAYAKDMQEDKEATFDALASLQL